MKEKKTKRKYHCSREKSGGDKNRLPILIRFTKLYLDSVGMIPLSPYRVFSPFVPDFPALADLIHWSQHSLPWLDIRASWSILEQASPLCILKKPNLVALSAVLKALTLIFRHLILDSDIPHICSCQKESFRLWFFQMPLEPRVSPKILLYFT